MEVRDFDGVNNRLLLGVGTSAIAVGSCALLVRPMSDGNKMLLDTGSGTTQFSIFQLSDGTFRVNYNSSFADSPFVQTAADGWCLFVVNKASGTATPRMHLYDFSSTTWSHGDGSASIANASTTTTAYSVGETGNNGGANADMRVLALAVWAGNAFASDAAAEALSANLAAWSAASPSSLWGFDQASVATDVLDLAGNAANQTAIDGTSVVDDTDISFNMALGGPARPMHHYRTRRAA